MRTVREVAGHGRTLDRLVVLRAALVGVCAYACAYAVTYATVVVAAPAEVGEGAPTWKVAGWLLHLAHFGRVAERPVGAAAPDATTYGLLSATDGSLVLLVVVPPLSTALAGFLLVWWLGANTPRRGAVLGALVAVGYPLGTLAVAGGTTHVTGDPIVAVEVRPLVSAVSVATSVAYPVAFGAVGGAVGGWLWTRVGP